MQQKLSALAERNLEKYRLHKVGIRLSVFQFDSDFDGDTKFRTAGGGGRRR